MKRIAGIGVGILYRFHRQKFVASWIAIVVGLHFLPLVYIFQDKTLYLLTTLIVLSVIVSNVIAKKVAISTVTLVGVSVGASLLLFALRGLLHVLFK